MADEFEFFPRSICNLSQRDVKCPLKQLYGLQMQKEHKAIIARKTHDGANTSDVQQQYRMSC